MAARLPEPQTSRLRAGTVIPAHPLALTAERNFDERHQRALTRYYVAAGVGGLAVGVHTTQFAIRDPRVGLLRPVLQLAGETLDETDAGSGLIRVAGAVGDTAQAVAETELAASLGYHAVLLSPSGCPQLDERGLLARAAAVGEVLPVLGFYLQESVGGRYLSFEFWRNLAELPCVVAVKVAPFDRYRTVEVLRGVVASGRANQVAVYTGNDDSIVTDLLSSFPAGTGLQIVGGLLGQWAVWTRAAVALHDDARRARQGDDARLRRLLGRATALTDINAALFDTAHCFRGCIAGVNHVLAQQGLLAGAWCLDPEETLSPGQAEEIERVRRAYPWALDDEFVAAHLDEWLR